MAYLANKALSAEFFLMFAFKTFDAVAMIYIELTAVSV